MILVGTYVQVTSDLISGSYNLIQKGLMDKQHTDLLTYEKLISHNSSSHKMYGLIKIHKENQSTTNYFH